MSGWHDLRFIDSVVEKGTIGAYVLSRGGDCPNYYVGRSDNDIGERLHDYQNSYYNYFRFTPANSSTSAYYYECYWYHKYKDSPEYILDNKCHPDTPDGSYLSCPVCGLSSQNPFFEALTGRLSR